MDPSNAVGRLALAMASSSALFLAFATATFGRQSIFYRHLDRPHPPPDSAAACPAALVIFGWITGDRQ
jgi:hypothetical protein